MALILEGRLGSVPIEDRFLAVHGHRCLVGLQDVDTALTPGWSEHWRRVREEDCSTGSWLAQFRERGQNLAQYKAVDPNRGAEDSYLVLAPMEGLQNPEVLELVEPVRQFLGIYFQTPIESGDPLPLPDYALHPEKGARGQYDAQILLESLKGSCPDGAVGCLAVTDRDLFVPGLQYVFGLGHFHSRVGVVSMYRLWEDKFDPLTGKDLAAIGQDPLRRALKVAVHEMAHEFSVAHCAHYRDCVMGGTNSLVESDRGSLMLCPLDHEKLRWNLHFDARARYIELSAWADAYGLHPEAAYWRRMADDFPGFANAAGGGR
jgi:archaemetzincin